MLKHKERAELIQTLEHFETVKEVAGNDVLLACSTWEILLHKYGSQIGPRTLKKLKARAKVALDKAIAA